MSAALPAAPGLGPEAVQAHARPLHPTCPPARPPCCSIKWQLGAGLDCAVKLYQMVQAQKEGPVRGAAVGGRPAAQSTPAADARRPAAPVCPSPPAASSRHAAAPPPKTRLRAAKYLKNWRRSSRFMPATTRRCRPAPPRCWTSARPAPRAWPCLGAPLLRCRAGRASHCMLACSSQLSGAAVPAACRFTGDVLPMPDKPEKQKKGAAGGAGWGAGEVGMHR